MKHVTEYSKQELNDMLKELTIQFQESKKLNLKLNMARGKPAAAQLDMNMGLLEFIKAASQGRNENHSSQRCIRRDL